MRHTRLIKYFALLILFTYLRADNAIVDEIIKKTQAQFEKANDYQVTMKIQLRVPGFRMPKKNTKFILNNLINSKSNLEALECYQKQGFLLLLKIILII